MKKLTALLTATLAISLAPMSSSAQTTLLKLAHFLPSGSAAQQKVLQPWCETLRKESNEQIKCQFYPALQLGGTAGQLVDQVKNGIADVVWTAPSYSAGRFPIIEGMELPFVVADSTHGSYATWKFYEQYAKEEFKDYKVLAVYNDGGVAVHTANKEMTKADDWQGLKLRGSNRMVSKTLQALGSSAVAMPPGQVTEAMSKGVIDGAMGTWEVVLPTKLDEVSKFHANPPEGETYPGSTVLVVLMNKKKFNALPEELQQLIDKHSGAALVSQFGKVWDEEKQVAQKKVLEHGNTITHFSQEEYQKMRDKTVSVEQEWIENMNKKGLDGKTMLESARQWVKE